jgi:hypothetical protein
LGDVALRVPGLRRLDRRNVISSRRWCDLDILHSASSRDRFSLDVGIEDEQRYVLLREQCTPAEVDLVMSNIFEKRGADIMS